MTVSTVATNPSKVPPSAPDHHTRQVIVIEAKQGGVSLDWRELIDYRDLFLFWTWRSIKVRYAQSALGIGWAIIQPLFAMLVFTLVFGKLAKITSDGAPYPVFSFAGLVPWTFFANSVTESTGSLVQNANMISKIYFPRLILPLAAICSKLVDFAIAMLFLFAMMAWFHIAPTWKILLLPCLVILMMITAAALGIWLTALAIQYRDIKYGINFLTQLLMYAAPVVYPTSLIPVRYQHLYAINPMVGVIEGFRSVLLDTRPIPWSFIIIGAASSLIGFVVATVYFRSKERLFADVA